MQKNKMFVNEILKTIAFLGLICTGCGMTDNDIDREQCVRGPNEQRIILDTNDNSTCIECRESMAIVTTYLTVGCYSEGRCVEQTFIEMDSGFSGVVALLLDKECCGMGRCNFDVLKDILTTPFCSEGPPCVFFNFTCVIEDASRNEKWFMTQCFGSEDSIVPLIPNSSTDVATTTIAAKTTAAANVTKAAKETTPPIQSLSSFASGFPVSKTIERNHVWIAVLVVAIIVLVAVLLVVALIMHRKKQETEKYWWSRNKAKSEKVTYGQNLTDDNESQDIRASAPPLYENIESSKQVNGSTSSKQVVDNILYESQDTLSNSEYDHLWANTTQAQIKNYYTLHDQTQHKPQDKKK